MNKKYETGLFAANANFIEEMYLRYLEQPLSVEKDWREAFDKIQTKKDYSYSEQDAPAASSSPRSGYIRKQLAEIANSYRTFGHMAAALDPLDMCNNRQNPNLTPHRLDEAMLDEEIDLNGEMGMHLTTARKAIDRLRQIYCSSRGFEYMHISDPEIREWLQEKIENLEAPLSQQERTSALDLLTKIEIFEQFLHNKFIGAKRFSGEGAEAATAAIEAIILAATESGTEEVIIGMAHRGRLDVLTGIVQKPYELIMTEFQGKKPKYMTGAGDVKYHLGATNDIVLRNGRQVRISLTPNPSHLEAVNAVAMGRARAKQEGREERQQVLSILVHGDASFAGQGVVSEALQLSRLEGYDVGGTMHIIVDNQVGFTTNPDCARSSYHASDIAKAVEMPILHLNGDDIDSVLSASKLAAEFRQKFSRDIVLHVVCYRKYGHNEGDEPSFTQPAMYKKIASHPSVVQQYQQKLIEENLFSLQEREEFRIKFLDLLGQKLEQSRSYVAKKTDWLAEREKEGATKGQTGMKTGVLKKIGKHLTSLPPGFNVSNKLKRILKNKEQALESGQDIDWATAEALAFGSLMHEGIKVRLAGQDSRRGTFSHRHATIIDQEKSQEYIPLAAIAPEKIEIINSSLSEYAAMGFEYGYSATESRSLVLWEGQFGDFVNGAQIIIDQFIAAAESKWNSTSNITLLLPHGYEGQGPEHSSARIERFLQLCAEDNMQAVNCSTPANYFHALRRQIYQNSPKPLIIFTPKSLLRHKLAISKIEEMAAGTAFETIIPDAETKKAKKIIICSGKIYYDLLQTRKEKQIKNIAIVRLEQYYPFPQKALAEQIKRHPGAKIIWCQEEPANMGAWSFVWPLIKDAAQGEVRYIGRPAAASPASGYSSTHSQEQQKIIEDALLS
ncbi:2-oxoglutarate dehydrogenase subunit E1 [Rickettsiales bacterium]|nr:2-oxoglutarate dehydrogenase subunit E1 [Rickettsiales bacterium]